MKVDKECTRPALMLDLELMNDIDYTALKVRTSPIKFKVIKIILLFHLVDVGSNGQGHA